MDNLKILSLDMSQISSNLLKKTARFSLHRHCVLRLFSRACAEIKISLDFSVSFFKFFFTPFLYSIFYFFVGLTFYWAYFQFNIFLESIIETGNFYHGVAKCSCRKFCFEFFTEFFLSIFVHISGSIEPMIPIWSKVMTLEVKQKPTLVMTG